MEEVTDLWGEADQTELSDYLSDAMILSLQTPPKQTETQNQLYHPGDVNLRMVRFVSRVLSL